jgi:hypothetical protein
MNEQKRIPVTYINGLWATEFSGFYFGGRTLARLIETLRHSYPRDVLLIAIDRQSVDGNAAAEKELLEASDAGGVLVEMS